MSAEGRHIFDRRPKPRAAKPGHYKDLTKTGNRDRKVSGTQGTVKPKYWANLFKYIFFVLFFCLLLHRLTIRISLPFYDFLQVIIVLILACVASVSLRFALPPPSAHSPNTSLFRCFKLACFLNSFLFRAPHIFFLYFRLLFRYVPLWFLARAPEFPTRGLNTEADRQSTMQSTVLSSKAVSVTVVYLRASHK